MNGKRRYNLLNKLPRPCVSDLEDKKKNVDFRPFKFQLFDNR